MKKPTFAAKTELARFIHDIHRMSGKRPAPAAFIDPPSAKPEKDYLSVNALEIESAKTIADYYRAKFQSGKGEVALSAHKVFDINETAKKCAVNVIYDKASQEWRFDSRYGKGKSAYSHQPVPATSQNPLKSDSHCGVDLVRGLTEHEQARFARRLSEKKLHVFK